MVFKENNVETIEINKKLLFNARDVSKILNISSVRQSICKMNNEQVILLKNSDIQNINFRRLNNRGESFLTKNGVYKLISSSSKMTYEHKIELLNFFGIEKTVPLFERKENVFVEQLEEFLSEYNLKGIKQYPVLNYKIDYYIPKIKLAIEYDEIIIMVILMKLKKVDRNK